MTDRVAAALRELTDHELFAIAGPFTDLRGLDCGTPDSATFLSNWPQDPPRETPTIVGSLRVLDLLDALNGWLTEEMSSRISL